MSDHERDFERVGDEMLPAQLERLRRDGRSAVLPPAVVDELLKLRVLSDHELRGLIVHASVALAARQDGLLRPHQVLEAALGTVRAIGETRWHEVVKPEVRRIWRVAEGA